MAVARLGGRVRRCRGDHGVESSGSASCDEGRVAVECVRAGEGVQTHLAKSSSPSNSECPSGERAEEQATRTLATRLELVGGPCGIRPRQELRARRRSGSRLGVRAWLAVLVGVWVCSVLLTVPRVAQLVLRARRDESWASDLPRRSFETRWRGRSGAAGASRAVRDLHSQTLELSHS